MRCLATNQDLENQLPLMLPYISGTSEDLKESFQVKISRPRNEGTNGDFCLFLMARWHQGGSKSPLATLDKGETLVQKMTWSPGKKPWWCHQSRGSSAKEPAQVLPGITKTALLAKSTIFWPGYTKAIEEVVKSCATCMRFLPKELSNITIQAMAGCGIRLLHVWWPWVDLLGCWGLLDSTPRCSSTGSTQAKWDLQNMGKWRHEDCEFRVGCSWFWALVGWSRSRSLDLLDSRIVKITYCARILNSDL